MDDRDLEYGGCLHCGGTTDPNWTGREPIVCPKCDGIIHDDPDCWTCTETETPAEAK